MELCDRLLDLYEGMVKEEDGSDFLVDLAAVVIVKAHALRDMGEKHAAVELYQQAIDIYERMGHHNSDAEWANSRARLWQHGLPPRRPE